MIKKPEILSPAGDMERLRFAVSYGADAVYLAGTSFGMRTASDNFDEKQMREAMEFCHARGVRAFVTVNTMPRNGELADMPEYFRMLEDIGADGAIIADIGVLLACKKYAPHVETHISTQANIVNYEAARAYHEMGASRVVLARELSLMEIAEIRAKTPATLEIEAFVHGAMCMSYSGRCYISDYLTGRDANRGACAQPCRWEYSLVERNRPNEKMDVYEDKTGSYLLNSKDLCMIDHIPELIQAGINSFKIEGRVKTAYYTALVTNAYRRAVDLYAENPAEYGLPEWIRDEVYKVSHREYATGFYFGEGNLQRPEDSGYMRSWEVCGMFDGERAHGGEILTQKNKFAASDELEIITPNGKPIKLETDAIFDEFGEKIESAPHAHQKVIIKGIEVPAYSMLRRRLLML